MLPQYRADLPADALSAVQRSTGLLDLPVLLPVLRHFLDRFRDGGAGNPQHTLKMWLA